LHGLKGARTQKEKQYNKGDKQLPKGEEIGRQDTKRAVEYFYSNHLFNFTTLKARLQ